MATRLAELYPADADRQMDLSTAYERLGMLELRRGNYQEARRHCELSLELAKQVGLAAPSNQKTQWEVSFSYSLLARACLATNDLPAAREASLQCLEVYGGMAQSAPAIARHHVLLEQTLRQLALCYELEGDSAAAIEYLCECRQMQQDFDERTNSRRHADSIAELDERIRKLQP